MAEDQNEIELRSEEIQEMLGRTPNWMTMWGASIILGTILMFFILAWFIRYPDVLSGNIRLTTKNPPIKLYARTSGKIQKLYFGNLQTVNKGQLIAEIESPVDVLSIEYLNSFIEKVKNHLISPGRLFQTESIFTFGDAQNDYNKLIENIQNYNNLINNPYYLQRSESLKNQIKLYKELVVVNQKQVELFEKQLQNAKSKFQVDQRLMKEEVYTKLEFIKEEDILTSKLMENENYKKSIIQSKITIADNEKQLKDLLFDFDEKKRIYLLNIAQSVKTLESFVKNWQRNNVITSPIAGKVAYLKPLAENQFIHNDDEMFMVVPNSEEYIGYVSVSTMGAGKIKPGQRVRIKFDNYPYEQFGNIVGVVTDISLFPDKEQNENKDNSNNYRVTIKLSNGLTTTYKKKLDFKPDMSGKAEIITDDLRILERIFFSLRKLLQNQHD